jgi:hypothetical protein
MKTLLKLEEAALVLLGLYAYSALNAGWLLFILLLFAPDLSMLGYLAGPKAGALTYNIVHHKAVAVLVYLLGLWLASPNLQTAGVILFTHSSLDRILGYGLKHSDSFHNTHLGPIGPAARG